MLRFDRVYCDKCGAYVGQLMAAPVVPAALPDQSKAPYWCVCPDCCLVDSKS